MSKCKVKKLIETQNGILTLARDAGVGVLSWWWSCQSPVAHSCSLLNHPSSCHGGMSQLKANFDADSLLYLLRHFECDGHTGHTLTQLHPLPPLTSTVKSSLFMHVDSSPLSLAARLHGCLTNHSCYINNDWTFSGQTSYIFLISNKYFIMLPIRNSLITLYTIYCDDVS